MFSFGFIFTFPFFSHIYKLHYKPEFGSKKGCAQEEEGSQEEGRSDVPHAVRVDSWLEGRIKRTDRRLRFVLSVNYNNIPFD